MTRSGPPKPLLECLTSGDVRPIRSASPLLLVASKNVQVNLTDCDKETTMYRILCVLMATIGYGAAAVYCQAPQAGTTAIISIFHLQRLSPASDVGGRHRNGYDSGESGLSGGEKGSVSRRHRRSHAWRL